MRVSAKYGCNMKAYLIDVASRTITETDYSGDYKDIYRHLGCSTFDLARIDEGDGIFVDDEGLLKGPVYNFFAIRGYTQPLAGKGLVLGSDAEGESIEPQIPIAWYRKRLVWIEMLFKNLWGVTHSDGTTSLLLPNKVMEYLSTQLD